MLFLQMACEMLCKARLMDGGASPNALRSSHGYVANPLPLIIRSQLEFMGESLRSRQGLLNFTRHLAAEIEVMNPAIDRNGQRPDNCEYPWEDAAQVIHSPLDWQFNPEQLLNKPMGPSFVKLLQMAIDRAVEELR